jgi:oxygen-independent coproporphyrinogen-3 oxidase
MYHEGSAFLQSRGYQRYEISNFSQPGRACRHNLKYWEMGEFLGAGPGASSYMDNRRWKNLEYIKAWQGAIALEMLGVDNNSLSFDSKRDRAGIFVFTGLRKAEGIRYADFRRQVGEDFDTVFPEARAVLEACEREGLVAIETGEQAGFRLTDAGIDRSNEIMSEFV